MRRTLLLMAALWIVPPTLSLAGGSFGFGENYQTWSSDFDRRFSGWECWTPLSLGLRFSPAFDLYSRSQYGTGQYTSQLGALPETEILTHFSDTKLGGDLNFRAFGADSLVSLECNLPTGDKQWETLQVAGNLPTDFVDTRYEGRAFGMSGMYAMALPWGKSRLGLAAGYQVEGAYQPDPGLSGDLKAGDAFFVAGNRVHPLGHGKNETFRASFLVYRPTRQDGNDVFQLGPNLNLSYSRGGTKGFSYEAGSNIYTKARRNEGGALVTEGHASLGQRFYVQPSYRYRKMKIDGSVKWVTANGYPEGESGCDGGGWLFGISPSLRIPMGRKSAWVLSTSYDHILLPHGGVDASGALVAGAYNRFTFGSSWEVAW